MHPRPEEAVLQSVRLGLKLRDPTQAPDRASLKGRPYTQGGERAADESCDNLAKGTDHKHEVGKDTAGHEAGGKEVRGGLSKCEFLVLRYGWKVT